MLHYLHMNLPWYQNIKILQFSPQSFLFLDRDLNLVFLDYGAWNLETSPSYGEPLKFRPNEEDGQKLAFNFVFNSF